MDLIRRDVLDDVLTDRGVQIDAFYKKIEDLLSYELNTQVDLKFMTKADALDKLAEILNYNSRLINELIPLRQLKKEIDFQIRLERLNQKNDMNRIMMDEKFRRLPASERAKAKENTKLLYERIILTKMNVKSALEFLIESFETRMSQIRDLRVVLRTALNLRQEEFVGDLSLNKIRNGGN